MIRIIFLLVLSFAEAISQSPVSLPPRRVAFEAKAPAGIQLGKLWWDIGLFHPFTGEVSRDEWERGFFALMNRSVEPGADAGQLAAEALALLKDPASLLLESGEGKGPHFLPIIWEVRGGKAWIIGGDKKQIKEPFGPVDQINDQPIQAFLTRRLGSYQSDDRIYAALTLAGRRQKGFTISCTAAQNQIVLSSISDLKELVDPWILGGWKDRSFYSLKDAVIFNLENLKATKTLDFRCSSWVDLRRANKIEEFLMFIGAQSVPKEVVRIVREHRGQWDEDWDRYAHDSGNYNRIGAHPSPNRIAFIHGDARKEATLPQVILDPILAECLAGWALPASVNTCARECQYAFVPGMEIRLRLESWCGSLADAKHQATYKNGGILTVAAAKALAAATVIEFDHLFGFSLQQNQERLFRSAVATEAISSDAFDFLERAGGVTKDPHVTTLNEAPFKTPLDRLQSRLMQYPFWSEQPVPSLPGYETNKGQIRLLRSITGVAKAGFIIESINGVPVAELVHKARPYTWARPENKDTILWNGNYRIGGKFGKPKFINSNKEGIQHHIIFKDEHSGKRSTLNLTDDWSIPPSLIENFIPPKGWEIAKTGETAPTVLEITRALEAGKKIIIDARGDRCLNIDGGLELPAPYLTPSHSTFRRTPFEPFAWGTDPYIDQSWLSQIDSTMAVRGYPQSGSSMKKRLPGSLVILVSGNTLSQLEFSATFLKEAFPLNTKIVGLPTGGAMGAITRLFLPVGGGDKSLLTYTPTSTWGTVGGKNYSFKGLPLDRQISEEELLSAMALNSPDPLMSAAIKALGIK
jgi:hypothetical protein